MKTVMLISAIVGVLSGLAVARELNAEDRAFEGALLRAVQNQPAEPYPGQREHKEPLADYACDHYGDKAHRCDCPGMKKDPMCKTAPNAEEEPEPEAPPEESRKCWSWCWPAHCHCTKFCDT